MSETNEHLLKCLTSLAGRLEAHEFSNVLSAWRGPDSEDFGLKKKTTEVIRRAILEEVGDEIPGLITNEGWGEGNSYYSYNGMLVAEKVGPVYIKRSRGSNFHFYAHIQYAAEALELEIIEEDDDS